ncbi:hypothetical protein OQA88_3473 [Cercophora sp. LCS_1]
MPSLPPKQRKIGSRSCDACKIRKVKCLGVPCERCIAIGIDCTFNKLQSPRGPRSLRAKTLQQIREVQGQGQRPEEPAIETDTREHHDGAQEISVESLVLRLCIYRLRLFPVWPIVAVEEVIAALQRDAHDVETHVLAAAIGAATMAQLKLDRFKDTGINDDTTAAALEAECQRVRSSIDSGIANLNSLRIAFFLHIYHENQQPGGAKSLLFLREAITLAQIMGLHRPLSYLALDPAEDRLRRRILWLLFVTERGVAMLHKLPVVLRSAENLPPLDSTGADDEAHILPAFKKLVNLFWIFDHSRAFDILQDAADDMSHGSGSPNRDTLDALQRRLQNAPLEMGSGGNDIQKADIFVTRQWMQVLLWRVALSNWRAGEESSSTVSVAPLQIAQEFLGFISQLPSAALEAHGPAIEFKVYEIASAVADSLATRFETQPGMSVPPGDVLVKLQRILATSRGGNSNLLGMLAARIAQAEPPLYPISDIGMVPAGTHVVEEVLDDDTRGWGVDSNSSEGMEPPQDRPLSQGSSTPWLSLVAAAELQQSNYNGAPPGRLPPLGAVPSWYSQSLGLLGQLYGTDIADSPGVLPEDILAGQAWLPGFGGPRIG